MRKCLQAAVRRRRGGQALPAPGADAPQRQGKKPRKRTQRRPRTGLFPLRAGPEVSIYKIFVYKAGFSCYTIVTCAAGDMAPRPPFGLYRGTLLPAVHDKKQFHIGFFQDASLPLPANRGRSDSGRLFSACSFF